MQASKSFGTREALVVHAKDNVVREAKVVSVLERLIGNLTHWICKLFSSACLLDQLSTKRPPHGDTTTA